MASSRRDQEDAIVVLLDCFVGDDFCWSNGIIYGLQIEAVPCLGQERNV